MSAHVIGTVRSLHRYPVKSMVGEELSAVEVGVGGIPGDRIWAVRNLDVGEQQGARQLPGLLGLAATLPEGDSRDVPIIGFPEGDALAADDPRASERLSAHLGKRLALVPLEPASNAAHYKKASSKLNAPELRRELGVRPGERAPDLSRLPLRKLAELGVYMTPPGTYYDAFPLHLLTTSSIRFIADQSGNDNIDPRRYRPNVVIDTGDTDGLLEASWEGAALEVGGCVIRVEAQTVRCSIPGRAQAIDGIEADEEVVRAVAEHAERHLGVYATIERAGTVRAGDAVTLVPSGRGGLANHIRRTQRSLTRAIIDRLLGDK